MTGVWVYSTDFSLYGELLTKADELAEKLGAGTAALLIGRDVRENADSLARMADKVYLLDRPELGWFEAGVYAEIIYRLAQQHEPDLIIVDSSRRGKELSARLATKLKAGCIPDCLRLDVEQGRVVADRMVYGGRAISTQACKTPAVVAVAPHAFEEKKLETLKRRMALAKLRREARIGDIQETIEMLTQRIDDLDAEIKALEQTLGKPTAS